MKLVRYGAEGREKPGLVDEDGRLRDLSAIVDDIDGHALSPKMLARIARSKVARLPLVRGKPRLALLRRVAGQLHRHRPELHRPRSRDRHGPAEGAGDLPEGVELRLRRKRPDHPAEGGREARLGGRGRHRHRHARPLRERARRDGSCRGLLPRQRPLRARRSARSRRHLDQGQERPVVRPAGALDGDSRRDRAPAEDGPVGSTSTASVCRTARRRTWSSR